MALLILLGIRLYMAAFVYHTCRLYRLTSPKRAGSEVVARRLAFFVYVNLFSLMAMSYLGGAMVLSPWQEEIGLFQPIHFFAAYPISLMAYYLVFQISSKLRWIKARRAEWLSYPEVVMGIPFLVLVAAMFLTSTYHTQLEERYLDLKLGR